MTRFLFPDFKKKALTFSYDDNTEQDRRLVCILRRCGLPATFNINTGSFGEKRWIEHYGFYCEYNRIEEKEVKSLYNGFEVASHTVDHVILPEDFLKWHPTCHDHDPRIGELSDLFLNDNSDELKLFYIWGHAFEFDKNDSDRWADMDRLCKKLSGKEDVWYATNREICDYVTATRSVKDFSGINNTGFDLFIEKDGEKIRWENGEKI